MYPVMLSWWSFPLSSSTYLAPPSMWSSLSYKPAALSAQYNLEQQGFKYCTAAGYDGYYYYLAKRPPPSSYSYIYFGFGTLQSQYTLPFFLVVVFRGESVSGAGWCYGFPHVTTMDNTSYSVDVLGEYWLINTVVTANNTYFSLQARTAPSISALTNKTSGGTSFVGFAMQGGGSPTIEVLIRDREFEAWKSRASVH